MTFVTLGIALMTAGISLAFLLSNLAEKPALAVMTCDCGCIAGGWTLIRAGWPTRRSKS